MVSQYVRGADLWLSSIVIDYVVMWHAERISVGIHRSPAVNCLGDRLDQLVWTHSNDFVCRVSDDDRPFRILIITKLIILFISIFLEQFSSTTHAS